MMLTIITLLAGTLTGGPVVRSQELAVVLDPATHEARVTSTLSVTGTGALTLRLNDAMTLERAAIDGEPAGFTRAPGGETGPVGTVRLDVPAGAHSITMTGRGFFEQDIEAGERAGEIHNFSVDAHVGTRGVFLSDGSAWYPQPVGAGGEPMLVVITTRLEPVEGWAFAASGDPLGAAPVDERCWQWTTPRPVEGVALAGNRHVILGVTHETSEGPVELVMHVAPDHEGMAGVFLEAAGEYLDLYVPRLGAFPYRRFTIVENFFSSGFAFPGFTLLGAQVVAMGPRALRPGYLDHELLHNWWGNGVYVDPADGNWCEALTSYCANYHRRIDEEGEDAGRAYRRGILMKLSTDPDGLDDGPLGEFGRPGGPGRFVGYDKGSFFFMMLDELLSHRSGERHARMWEALRQFAATHLGQRAGWKDLQQSFESVSGIALDGFFDVWVRGHALPRFAVDREGEASLRLESPGGDPMLRPITVTRGSENGRDWVEPDPDFLVYRVLPPEQIIPTIAGTLGHGGLVAIAAEERDEAASFMGQVETDDAGENLLLIGDGAIGEHATLLARTSDPITIADGSFTVGGETYAGPGQAVLHTMQHPDRPGRFITVFHSNGEAGWSRLRLIRFYTRDTTIIWEDGRVIQRRTFEPDRRLMLD